MIFTKDNELHIGDIPISQLVEKYGEPMYVYDAEVIEGQYRKLRKILPDEVEILYSMKANPALAIVSFLSNLTEGIEVSSLRELFVARQSGYAPERIVFVG